MKAEQAQAACLTQQALVPMYAIEIEVADRQQHIDLRQEPMGDFVQRVLQAEGVRHACISLAIVDDATIGELHRRFLSVDGPTDVLSFPLGNDPLEGEVVVNAEQAVRVAGQLGGRPEHELLLYVVHGTLHLCGYDDRNETDAAVMRRRQSALLADWGIFPANEPGRWVDETSAARGSGEE